MPHPASGEEVDIPDVAGDTNHEPAPDYARSDYSDASIPDVAGETHDIAERT